MKKLFAIAFTCVYLTLAVGVVRTTHYCLGRVKSASLFSFETSKCPCYYLMSANSSKNCCTDEHDILQIDNDQTASSVVSIAPDFFEIGPLFETIPLTDHKLTQINFSMDESPPPLSDVPLFTKHCSLVFYDAELIG